MKEADLNQNGCVGTGARIQPDTVKKREAFESQLRLQIIFSNYPFSVRNAQRNGRALHRFQSNRPRSDQNPSHPANLFSVSIYHTLWIEILYN